MTVQKFKNNFQLEAYSFDSKFQLIEINNNKKNFLKEHN